MSTDQHTISERTRHHGAAGRWLRGITWDHPRGYAPLDRLAELDGAGDDRFGAAPSPLVWDRQPLEGFESTPLAQLAGRYDLLVIDHPHLADAVATGELRPLDDLFDADELARWSGETVGPSFASYGYGGRQWAVPLDAATQVMAVGRGGPPAAATTTWAQVARVAATDGVTLCLGGPHAFLTWTSIALALGATPAVAPHEYLDRELAVSAMEMLMRLAPVADPVSTGNPIQVLEAIAAGSAPPLCPLVFGYVTYSDTDDGSPVRFRNAPAGPQGHIGSVLGGTGIAVSAHCPRPDLAAGHIRRLMSATVQRDLVPAVGGQPSHHAAWTSPEVDDRWAGFYSATRATLDAAWVRPRRRGWVAFSDEASAIVRDGLATSADPIAVIDAVDAAYTEHY